MTARWWNLSTNTNKCLSRLRVRRTVVKIAYMRYCAVIHNCHENSIDHLQMHFILRHVFIRSALPNVANFVRTVLCISLFCMMSTRNLHVVSRHQHDSEFSTFGIPIPTEQNLAFQAFGITVKIFG